MPQIDSLYFNGGGRIPGQDIVSLNVQYYDITVMNKDFQSRDNSYYPTKGIVKKNLVKGKPVYCCGNNSSPANSVENEYTFSQWFSYVPGQNIPIPLKLDLLREPINKTNKALGNKVSFSSENFFPIDSSKGYREFHTDHNSNLHNFHFCMELHAKFRYISPFNITVTSDDDSFLFIGDRLVMDLGGVHYSVTETLDIGKLGLLKGLIYSLDFFYCERKTGYSILKFEFPDLTNYQRKS